MDGCSLSTISSSFSLSLNEVFNACSVDNEGQGYILSKEIQRLVVHLLAIIQVYELSKFLRS
jgi:hypothetical protein